MDWKVGLPNLLISIEMAIFSILHLWAFSWKDYTLERMQSSEVTDFYGNGKTTYQGGWGGFKALLDALNPLDLFKAVSRGFRWLFVGRKKRTMDPSYQAPFEQIGLDHEDPEANVTAYEGAGPLMAGGRTSFEQEADILLSHAQPNPTTPVDAYPSRTGLTPSPYEEDLDHAYFPYDNRPHDQSMLDPSGHSPRPVHYDETHNNPYTMPYEAQHGQQSYHHRNVSDPHDMDPSARLYHTDGLQEHDPIPMPDPYQPPPYDDHHNGHRY